MSGSVAAAVQDDEDLFSLAAFRARVDERLSFEIDEDKLSAGDHILDRIAVDPDMVARARLAAVLVPVVARPDDVTVLLTQRAGDLRNHSGQVAFPGGKIDPGDRTPVEAALREAHEEIGLVRERVEPLAFLDPYLTGTGFKIVPVVAIVQPPFDLTVNPAEVDAAFEVPLRFLMEATNHERREVEWGGRMRRYYAMPYERWNIWGATAGILRNLYERLYG